MTIEGLPSEPAPVPTHIWPELDSTNAFARRLAESDDRRGPASPVWIAARRQTAGRGRRGRTWESRLGNLAASLHCVTDVPAQEAAQLSFVFALAVRDMAGAYVPESLVKLKWPNDVLLAGRKVSGILIESGRRFDGRIWIVAGVGVNLVWAPEGTEFPATCLADHLKAGVAAAPTLDVALEQLSDAVIRRAAVWTRDGFGPIREAWLDAAAGIGERCTVRLGDAALQGVAEGLDEDGALQLRLDNGELRRITAGDVFFGPA